MAKKCIICNELAVYQIKDTTDYYCSDCAEENFADLSLLVKVEEEAQKLKQFLKEQLEKKLAEERETEDDDLTEEESKSNNKDSKEKTVKKKKNVSIDQDLEN